MPFVESVPARLRCVSALCVFPLLVFGSATHVCAEPVPVALAEGADRGEPAPGFSAYESPGPHHAEVKEDVTLTLRSRERVPADVYRTDAPGSSPLVILVHGYDNGKADHAYQCMHLATWGMHCLALQVRNRGPWVNNGTLLVRVVQHLRANPGSLGASFDAGRIVLVGHSFGATAVVVALAGGASVRGAVLLDPADAIRGLPGYLRKVRTPVAILGADQRIAVTRNRDAFRTHLAGSVVEGSIAEARHEDAQFPLTVELASAEPGQLRFVAALTAAARSLGDTGRLDQVWIGFRAAARRGEMIELRRR